MPQYYLFIFLFIAACQLVRIKKVAICSQRTRIYDRNGELYVGAIQSQRCCGSLDQMIVFAVTTANTIICTFIKFTVY